jgi:hypothetical protein
MIESTRVPYTNTEYQPELTIEITKVLYMSNRAQDTEHQGSLYTVPARAHDREHQCSFYRVP